MARTKKSSVAPVEVETIVSEVVGEMEVTTRAGPRLKSRPKLLLSRSLKLKRPVCRVILSQVSALSSPEPEVKKTKSQKNENVWGNVKMLFAAGKTNKETLAEIHEMYGNTSTTYACIAWYRNKYNKLAKSDKMTVEQLLNQVACQFGQDQEWIKAQVAKL
jgi:hypothetical protein